jgi:hypothetical protein
MSSANRIYIVSPKGDDTQSVASYRLVRAGNVNQAMRHVAMDTLEAAVAGQDALVFFLGQGVKVEDAVRPAVVPNPAAAV